MNQAEALAAWGNIEPDLTPLTDDDMPWADEARDTPIARYKHYKPLSDSANRFVEEAQSTRRFYTGIPQFDEAMRGLSPGYLCLIVGYSHSGKTQLLLHMLRANRLARVALFTADEPGTLVLTKLTSTTHNISAAELEQRVANGDREAIELLVQTATEEFPNLIVFDKPITPRVLDEGYKEACEVWGGEADCVVVDYVDLVQGAEIAPQKMDILKSFVSVKQVPMIAIHQTSRSGGADGRAMTISSGNYGGEQHATMMIGVRRKKSAILAELAEQRVKQLRNPSSEAIAERISELEHDLKIHEYTLTANVVKNKRPGGGLVDEIDFELALSTGRIYQLEEGELPKQYKARLSHAPVSATPTKNWEEQEMFDNAA